MDFLSSARVPFPFPSGGAFSLKPMLGPPFDLLAGGQTSFLQVVSLSTICSLLRWKALGRPVVQNFPAWERSLGRTTSPPAGVGVGLAFFLEDGERSLFFGSGR